MAEIRTHAVAADSAVGAVGLRAYSRPDRREPVLQVDGQDLLRRGGVSPGVGGGAQLGSQLQDGRAYRSPLRAVYAAPGRPGRSRPRGAQEDPVLGQRAPLAYGRRWGSGAPC